MVIDTSAVLAIFFDEPECGAFARRIVQAETRLMSTVSKLESCLVATGRLGDQGVAKLHRLFEQLDIVFVPFDEHQSDIASEAFERFGKGRHRAGLNFGDCAAYALAVAEAMPLLFKGVDFELTDVETVRLSE